ncbi:hypothetical protein G6F23_012853 [Rhizopus arrhizus]|nr:hypothetical protein G6F23_012853 [Rhizopus arrhizus]
MLAPLRQLVEHARALQVVLVHRIAVDQCQCHVHGTCHPEAARIGALRLQVEGHRFDDRHRQAPQAQQIGARLGVAGTRISRQRRFGTFVAHTGQQQADVGQQGGGRAQFGAGFGQQACGQPRGKQGALLQRIAFGGRQRRCREHFAGQHQVAQRSQAQPGHRGAQVGDGAALAEERRVRQLQYLGGDGRIGGDQLGDVSAVGIVVVLQRLGVGCPAPRAALPGWSAPPAALPVPAATAGSDGQRRSGAPVAAGCHAGHPPARCGWFPGAGSGSGPAAWWH